MMCYYMPAVKLLLQKGADVNHIDKNNKTALVYATVERHSDIVTMLINSNNKTLPIK